MASRLRPTRRTVARHGALSSPTPLAQAMKFLAVSVAVVLVAAVGVAAYVALDLSTSIATRAVDIGDEPAQPPALGEYDGPFTVMLVGTDECEDEIRDAFGGRCSGPEADGQLNDVNLLVHVSDHPRRVTAVSFPRDLMVPIPECTDEDGSILPATRYAQINAAYGRGGLSCVVDTVSELSGLDVPFAAKVSFGNVINITDAVGGVDVCIGNGGIRDYHTGIDWPEGMRNIQGWDALQFLRTRHGVGDGSDLARIGNQQQYLSRLVNKVRSDEVLADPGAVLRLASTASRNITPSTSLVNPVRIAQLALTLRNIPPEEITFVQYPVFDDPNDPNKVIPDREGAEVLWEALAQNRPLEITGDISSNEGVIEVGGAEEPQTDADAPETPEVPESPEAPPTTADPSASPDGGAVALPGNINGKNAAQETCSAGNVGVG